MSVSSELLAAEGELWAAMAAHPFLVAAANGSLPTDAFDRWLVEDHHFVVGFRRFLARLVELAPTEPARDLLGAGLGASAGDEVRGRMVDAFVTSSRYELGFWQMAWDRQQWGV